MTGLDRLLIKNAPSVRGYGFIVIFRKYIYSVLRAHILPISAESSHNTVSLHQYADDCQVYKALHNATAAYLVDDCQLVSHAGRRRLRSANIDTCCVPWTNTWFGDRSFAAVGPWLWNSLPARIHQPDNDTGEFHRQLKSFLFK